MSTEMAMADQVTGKARQNARTIRALLKDDADPQNTRNMMLGPIEVDALEGACESLERETEADRKTTTEVITVFSCDEDREGADHIFLCVQDFEAWLVDIDAVCDMEDGNIYKAERDGNGNVMSRSSGSCGYFLKVIPWRREVNATEEIEDPPRLLANEVMDALADEHMASELSDFGRVVEAAVLENLKSWPRIALMSTDRE